MRTGIAWTRGLLSNLRDLEPANKEAFLRSDADLTAVAIAATACLIPPMNYLDYSYYGLSPDYLAATVFEVVFATLSVVAFVVIRRSHGAAAYERWVFAWSLFTAVSALFIVLSQANRLTENILFGDLFLIALYTLITNRLSLRLVPALVVDIGCIAALFLTNSGVSWQNQYMFGCSLVAINLAGLVAVARSNRFKRLAYQAQMGEREARRLFETLAATDPLTGILNRRSFFAQAQQECSRFRRFHSAFCLVMIDLDFFKRVNDQYGHQAGDEALKAFANTIASGKRSYDVFGRLGGEEFALLLPDTSAEDAVRVVSRLKDNVRQSVITSPKGEFGITFSAGIASALREAESLDDLIHRADEALYQSKAQGRDRIALDAQ
jgi:diguanylate cyclase (GGDEF)-like protein